MVHSVKNMVELAPESIGRAKDTLVKSKYLKRIEALLKEDPDAAIKQFEEFREAFCKLENIRILVIADLEKLKSPVSGWKSFVDKKKFVSPSCPSVHISCIDRDRMANWLPWIDGRTVSHRLERTQEVLPTLFRCPPSTILTQLIPAKDRLRMTIPSCPLLCSLLRTLVLPKDPSGTPPEEADSHMVSTCRATTTLVI